MPTTPKTLTQEDCEKLLTALAGEPYTKTAERKFHRNFTMALLMLDAGLRVGEVVGLLISDLIYNSVPVTSLRVRSEIAKKHRERIIPISRRLCEALKKMLAILWSQYNEIGPHRAFVSGYPAKQLTTRQVERIIRSAAMKSLGRPVHPHVLRHTFASRLMRTTNARIVQELLGHKNISSTQIYTHPNGEDLKKAISSIEPDIQCLASDPDKLST